MCGIAGYIGRKEICTPTIESCLEQMKHRGPDDQSWWRHWRMNSDGRHVYLLHSRLSIIDLDKRANQPFQFGDYVLVFNGEIYNYVELRRELNERGHIFRTRSDTEVLLRILIEQGWRGLEKCEGMWAFALYDQRDGSLILSRDRFGEKPLYFYRADHGLYFGSEPKFIFTLLGDRLKIDYDQLYRYMINGYKSLYKGGDTFFMGLQEVHPGSTIHVEKDIISRQYYWHPNFEQDDFLSYNDAVEQVKESLINSVKLRLRSDVPLAFCMSGGVDSNSLISIAKRVLDYDVHGFTVVSKDGRYDEQEEVNYVVQELGINHTQVYINKEGFLDNIRKIVVHHDAPVYTISYYLHWILMGWIADKGYKVSISGTGADELFTGYYDHYNQYLCEMRDHQSPFEKAYKAWQEYIRPIVRNPFLKNPWLYFNRPDFRDHIYLDNDKFSEYLPGEWPDKFTETNYVDSLLRNRMLNELFHESVPVILHEDDLNSMYYSVENRSPFLDRDLFELSCRIPTRHLIQNGYTKAVLRDAMKGIVPDKILQNRRKVGFNAPVHEFLDVKDREVRESLLDDSLIFEHVDKGMMEKLIGKDYLENSESKFLFYFLNAKIFMEEFG